MENVQYIEKVQYYFESRTFIVLQKPKNTDAELLQPAEIRSTGAFSVQDLCR